jgi:putative DNA primase/helicase
MTFALHAQACGVLVEDLSPSDRIRRCGTTDHPRGKSGAYLWTGTFGWVCRWDAGAEIQIYGEHVKFSAQDKAEWLKRKRETESRVARTHEVATLKAAILLRDCEMQNHPYLERKGFKDELGFVDHEGRLLIPMRDCITNDLRGVQRIEWLPDERVFTKKMQHGMKAKGAAFRFGLKTAPVAWLVEGYATALSVHTALRKLCQNASVVACFSDSNMVTVAGMIGGNLRIFADNDKSGAGEAAAIKAGCRYCMADQVGMDANDIHQRDGLMAVQKKILTG